MTELESNKEFLRFFRKCLPLEIQIDKNNIFYRDKYNEIINYIKILLTNSMDLEVYKYVDPKGALLLNIFPGTDIVDYIKLICSNYYLEFIELNNSEINKTPDEFYDNFNKILESFIEFKELRMGKEEKTDKEKSISDEDNKKRLLLINQNYNLNKIFNSRRLLSKFTNSQLYDYKNINFINSDLIIVWLNYDYEEIEEISENLFKNFDLFLRIPILNKIERETVLRDFSESNQSISFDINTVVNYTENWEVADIRQLLKTGIFKHFLNADLNEISNEITDILINMIESGEYIPAKTIKKAPVQDYKNEEQNYHHNERKNLMVNEIKENESIDKDTLINEIKSQNVSEFMLEQLYENAASKNYNELILIIDKLNKKESLEENDRKIIAKYPFILNDSPNRAQINLEKAKKRIDLLHQAFGK